MSCLRPITIINPRYRKLLKTPKLFTDYLSNTLGYEHCFFNSTDKTMPFGYLPIDYKITVPCGKCAECRKRKRLSWSHRLAVEVMQHKESTFLTLTLDDESLERFKDEPKKPLLLFIDRLRKHLGYRPKYFFVSELGEKTRRLHYHGVIFGTGRYTIPFELLRGKWQYGIVWLADFCNVKTANYITKYMLKDSKGYKPFMLCSNGIGLAYVNPQNQQRFINNFQFNSYTKIGSAFYPLHRYYQDKFMDDDLRLVKMLNDKYDTSPREYVFKRIKYKDELSMLKAKRKYYDWTLTLDKEYGSIHNPKTRTDLGSVIESTFADFENNFVRPWHADSDFVQGHFAW